jgi:hypothetical protein
MESRLLAGEAAKERSTRCFTRGYRRMRLLIVIACSAVSRREGVWLW